MRGPRMRRALHERDGIVVDLSANERTSAREQAADWALRLETAPGDEALRRSFEQWLAASDAHRTAFARIRHVSSVIDRRPRNTARDAAGARADNIVDLPRPQARPQPRHDTTRPGRRPHPVRWLAAGAALAAACLALVLFPAIQRHVLADYVTGVAELREVPLPDGSVAWLDAGSAIALDYRDSGRGVTLLSGQAFFEVAHDSGRPFHVEAEGVSVVVTGTSFGVRLAPHAVAVDVRTGSVEVAVPGGGTPSRLGVGDSLVYDRETRTVRRAGIAPADVAMWRSRRLVVHDRPFDDILDEIGRHLPGAIVVRDGSLNRQMVSGVFDLSNPPDALQALVGSQRGRLTQITPYLGIVSKD